MKEDVLFEEVLELVKTSGAKVAYDKMLRAYPDIASPNPQFYYFLSCLASLNKRKDEAIDWLRESIGEKGYFYRPEVLEDKDLDFVRGEAEFVRLAQLSHDRYGEVIKTSEMQCTWQKKFADDIFLVFHGNQQNSEISRSYWKNISVKKTQIEYIQSADVDSLNRYRWCYDVDYSDEILKVLGCINWDSYQKRTLCGFSAACNVILNLINERGGICDSIILIAPWIPIVDTEVERLVQSIEEHNISVTIICGNKDIAIKRVRVLEDRIRTEKGMVRVHYIDNMGHRYPDDLRNYIS